MRFIRNTHLYAYLCGLTERLRFGDGFGRTHASDQDWNIANDRGANAADWLTGSRS